ncbi:MAG: tetratricopeptide repeat protein [Betaproteobacteria bacterium]|jgi:Tfp pilus assembly protein PilF|nr:tetratricopeptide repeat protein [Betaproteobacteria bacterium]
MNAAEANILDLIATRRERRPERDLAALSQLFRRLAACAAIEASETEDRIWDMWMDHPHRAAAAVLDAATRDIAARRYDIAETRLSALLRAAPRYAEAWHKRATLYYLLGRDDECLHDIRRTLELEPRHFAAMLHFGEILLGEGAETEARYAFAAALTLHPHLPRARSALADPA